MATPLLVNRIARTLDPGFPVEVLRPIRKSRGTLLEENGLEREIQVAGHLASGRGGILVLIDSEGDCPKTLAPALLSRARSTRPNLPVSVVLAHHEYESWFIESAPSLRGYRSLPSDLDRPMDQDGHSRSERISGAKEWLAGKMKRKYLPTSDQPALTSRFSLALARRTRSFDKCYREVVTMLRSLVPPQPPPDSHEVAIACADRFDGPGYKQAAGFDPWPILEIFWTTGAWNAPELELWATYSILRSGLCRWSIENEPPYNGIWCAFRSLFLRVAATDPPANWRVAHAEEAWHAQYLHDLDYYRELIHDIHQSASYENGFENG